MANVEIAKMAIIKKEYIEFMFLKYYNAWNGHYNDDRALFCNIYNQLIWAIKDLEKCNSICMVCAFNHEFEKDIDMMRKIIECFKDMKN